MSFRVFLTALCGLSAISGLLPADDLQISGEKIRAHVKYLASDDLEGRGVGTRGGELAANYLATQLQAEGVKPGGKDGSYFQPVPLVGVTTGKTATLTFRGKNETTRLKYVTDFVGTSLAQTA